jgi:hypothetical protein
MIDREKSEIDVALCRATACSYFAAAGRDPWRLSGGFLKRFRVPPPWSAADVRAATTRTPVH